MIGCAYTRSLYDPCIYFLKLLSGKYIYLLLCQMICVGSKAHYSSFDDINSCSYSTNDLVFSKSQTNVKILVGI